MALQMVIVLEGLFMSSLPPGQLVTSRADCASMCYRNPGCLSVFYDTSTRQCVQVNAVYCEADMDTPALDMQYLVWDGTQKGCIDGYTLEEQQLCYKVYEEASWHNARDRCELDGGQLVSVNNSCVNEFMYQLCLSEDADLWTGGNDIASEVTWVWADNSAFIYSDWVLGQPNNNEGAEDCMLLVCDDNTGQWRDLPCDDEYKFVCQTPMIDIPRC